MTQEVQVTLTLEVDATKSKEDVIQNITDLFSLTDNVDLIKVLEIKEESEIYGTNWNKL